jgi:hypothetical protein
MKAARTSAPGFAKLVRAQPAPAAVVAVRVGAAPICVEAGFDAELLRSVVSVLSGSST